MRGSALPVILLVAVPAWGQRDDHRAHLELGSEDAPSASWSASANATTSIAAIDYDADDDGLIEIATLAQLNAVRWDLNGNGRSDSSRNASAYSSAFPNAATEMGCTPSCSGYELGASATSSVALTFRKGDDYAGDGRGWRPIGDGSTRFGATFKGNGHAIRDLTISRSTLDDVGLFGATSETAFIDGVRLVDVSISGNTNVGGLVGDSLGRVIDSHVTGITRGDAITGGLMGRNGGSILASSAVGDVSGRATTGGLVGTATAQSTIASSYAICRVTGTEAVGGLVGELRGSLTATYASSHVEASSAAGGLVGRASGSTISASYANGSIATGLLAVGGLVGRADGGTAEPTIADSYWDVDTAGYNTSAGGTGMSSEQLRAVTSATGTYANWDDLTVDSQGAGNDDPWDFGTASQYPVLNFGALSAAAQRLRNCLHGAGFAQRKQPDRREGQCDAAHQLQLRHGAFSERLRAGRRTGQRDGQQRAAHVRATGRADAGNSRFRRGMGARRQNARRGIGWLRQHHHGDRAGRRHRRGASRPYQPVANRYLGQAGG